MYGLVQLLKCFSQTTFLMFYLIVHIIQKVKVMYYIHLKQRK